MFLAVEAKPDDEVSVLGLSQVDNLGASGAISSAEDIVIESSKPLDKAEEDSKGLERQTEVISSKLIYSTATISDDTEDNSSNLSIPTFSYTLVSPVSSPPEFSHMSGLKFDSNYDDTSGSGSSLPRDDDDRNINKLKIDVSPRDSEIDSDVQEVTKTLSCSSTNKSPFLEKASPIEEITPTRKTPKSFLESGGFVQPPALGHFPLPKKGQSLTSFLSSLSDTCLTWIERMHILTFLKQSYLHLKDLNQEVLVRILKNVSR